MEAIAMTETFRLRKAVKYQGMAFTVFFLAAVVGFSSIFFLEEPAKHGFKGEHSVAIVGGMGIVVFGTMFIISIYIWAAYYVERFTIHGTMLSVRSMFQNREFDASDLECLKWNIYPLGGSVGFRGFGSKARLAFYGFSKDDRLRIIRSLRDLVPPEVQEGWPLFCPTVAVPLRDGRPSKMATDAASEAAPAPKSVLITRSRYDRMFLFGLPLSVAVAIGCWLFLNLWQFVALPFLMVPFWLLLRFNIPPEGRRETPLTSTSMGRGHLIGWGALGGSQLLMMGLFAMGFDQSIVCWAAGAVMLAAFPPMVYLLHKSDKHTKKADERCAELALEVWQQGECTSKTAALDS